MKTILIACALVLPLGVKNLEAQSLSSSVIGSAGEHFATSRGSLTWTLGEIMTETYVQGNGILTQGFHQPLFIRVTGLDEQEEKAPAVYPNPVKDFLKLQATENGDYQIELFNLQGQKIVNEGMRVTTGTQIYQVDMRECRSAIYLLRVTNTTNGKDYCHKIEKY